MKNRIIALTVCLSAIMAANAVNIVRYVAEGATGDGLTAESPTGDLKGVLEMSYKVDKLTIYASPGTFKLPLVESPGIAPTYRNVYLFGGGEKELLDSPAKTVIEGDLEIIDGLVVNIDFKGADYKDRYGHRHIGSLRVTGCQVYCSEASVLTYTALPSYPNQIYSVKTKTLNIKRSDMAYGKTSMDVSFCTIVGGQGVSVENVSCTFRNCNFFNNTRGAYLYGQDPSTFTDCWFLGNFAQGAINVDVISDNPSAYIYRCVFAANASTDQDCCSVIYGVAPFVMESSLIAHNKRHAGYGQQTSRWNGAVELHRRQSLVANCTFWENEEAAIYYWKSSEDHYYTREDQVVNCLFLGNKYPYISYYSDNSPKMMYCAADFGSDIPELDAERHNFRINAQNVRMTIDENYHVEVLEGSPLINAGVLNFGNDINRVSHFMLGNSDIGCAEYVGNWEIETPEKKLTIDDEDFLMCKTSYKGSPFYAYVNKNLAETGISLSSSIYLGNNLSPLKQYGEEERVLVFMNTNGQKRAVMYRPAFPVGWEYSASMVYENTLPVAVKRDGVWKLEIPKTTGTASKTGTARKSTPARKTTPKRR